MARKFGAVVAPENQKINRSKTMLLDTDKPQFKYYRTVFLRRFIPATTTSTSVTLQYAHGLPYLPSFDTFLKGHKGTWGKVLRGAQAINIGGYKEFPYTGTEWVDQNDYNLELTIYGGTTPGGTPLHEVVLRLTLAYEEAADERD